MRTCCADTLPMKRERICFLKSSSENLPPSKLTKRTGCAHTLPMKTKRTFSLKSLPENLPPAKLITRTGCSHTLPMKTIRNCSLKSSPENLAAAKLTEDRSTNHHQSRKIDLAESPMERKKRNSESYLPDDCWEIIIKLSQVNFNSVSLVSKQFLSITNRLRFSLSVNDASRHYLPRLLKRFTNLTSLDLSRYNYSPNDLLCKISNFPLKKLTSLKLPVPIAFPADGLHAFCQTVTTLTSLTCSRASFDHNQLLLVAHCFPLLKHLDLSRPWYDLSQPGFAYVEDHINGISSLLYNSPYIQHLDLSHTNFLNDQHVAEFSLFLAHLVSINLTGCWKLTESALFSLVTNCPSLGDIKMEYTTIGNESIGGGGEDSSSFAVVCPKVKSLSLARCLYLRDQNIVLFASIFPNLEVLDLSYWKDASEETISQVVKCCSKIKHLNLSHTKVDDKSLHIISASCCGLLQLLLESCMNVTENGVKHVVQNCKQLREINLRDCDQMNANVVSLMLLSRPSLRKIIAPLGFSFSDRKRKVFMQRHGCLVC